MNLSIKSDFIFSQKNINEDLKM